MNNRASLWRLIKNKLSQRLQYRGHFNFSGTEEFSLLGCWKPTTSSKPKSHCLVSIVLCSIVGSYYFWKGCCHFNCNFLPKMWHWGSENGRICYRCFLVSTWWRPNLTLQELREPFMRKSLEFIHLCLWEWKKTSRNSYIYASPIKDNIWTI